MKNVTKRLLSVVLALVLCLSLLPGIALAADSYKKVTGLSDVTAGGKFVVVVNNNGSYLAMDDALASGKGCVIDAVIDTDDMVRPMVPGGAHITHFLLE